MMKSFVLYLFLLLITIEAKVLASADKNGPGAFIYTTFNIIPEIEHFVELQIKLEEIREGFNLDDFPESENSEIITQLPEVKAIIDECKKFHKFPSCNFSLYRTSDGSCNNIYNPEWGRALINQHRILPAFYEGQSGIRKAVDGGSMPTPRSISLSLKNESFKSTSVSAFFTFFGQFAAHDLTLVPVTTINKALPDCCDPDLQNNPKCAPIMMQPDDQFYSMFNVTCINFVRGAAFPFCNFSKRSVINKKTSFIDLSNMYGNNDIEAKSHRKYDGSGKLKTQTGPFGDLPIKSPTANRGFCVPARPDTCLDGGDERVNQNTMLTIVHIIYLRLHNMVADRLKDLNPYWNDEQIYQEGRRIVIAFHQNILFKEYLHLLIGSENMDKYNLNTNIGEESLYEDFTNPSVFAEFSVAAFRLHSMIPKEISKYSSLQFRDTYSFATPIFQGNMSSLVSGSCEVESEKNDEFVVKDVTDFLYKPPEASYGFDMAAFNIQRGRDAGLPPYIELVKYCLRLDIKDFSDLNLLMTKENVNLLRNMYNNVEDIDAWVGLIVEKLVHDGVVGPTAACILGLQFHKLKFGDSFFYTHTNSRYPFTKDQLKSINSFNLAHFICITLNVPVVRRYPLMTPSLNNPLISCDSFSSLNLEPWKE